jgi:hypothetical protein
MQTSLIPRLGLTIALAACASAPAPTTTAAATPSAASPAMPARTGDIHDFDFFDGGWTAHQRRLRVRGVGSNDWDEFPSSLCMKLFLDGMATVDEVAFPTKGWSGLTIRTFSREKRQWSIYWVSSKTGEMGPPQVGGFDGDRGEFYGEDEDGGHRVLVRYAWTKQPPDHARWEQAFSRDGKAWETNWIADFTRADTAATCVGARPRTAMR